MEYQLQQLASLTLVGIKETYKWTTGSATYSRVLAKMLSRGSNCGFTVKK